MESPRLAIVFDFGNVVCRLDYAPGFRRLAEATGWHETSVEERARGAVFLALMRGYESGQLTTDQFLDEAARLFPGVERAVFIEAWGDIFRPNPPITKLVAALKKRGHRLILGSNTNELHAIRFQEQFADVLSGFDELVLSYRVGVLKPGRAFYQACAEAAGREPASCVFIDDLAANVEGARAAGLIGIVYDDHARLEQELRALGVSWD